VTDERDLRARLDLRDGGLRRLQSLTGVLIVAATALAGIFTGIAAGTTAGRKLIRVQPRRAIVQAAPARATRVPPPPALPPLGSQAGATPTPAAPAQPPAAAPPAAPPVVVSGGS
jgi:hypothetical protein